MKKIISTLIVTTVITAISFTACKKDKEDFSQTKPDLPDISVVDISEETDWDYWVGGEKDFYFINSDNDIPTEVFFHSYESDKDFAIFFRSDGLPDKVIVDSYIYLFDNFNGNKVDIGIINPNGEIQILREVESEADWDSNSKAWSDVIRWTGRVVGGIPCALSVAGTVATGGVGWPVAAWTCGNYILGLSADIAQNEFDVHNGFTDFVDTYGSVSTYYGCATDLGLSCLTDLSSSALSEMADRMEELENRSDEIQVTVAALYAGYGDVQITLTWDNEADLDLHVFDPNNEEIFWQHTYSASGGILDYDDIDGYGPENIYWPEGDAPEGNYKVYVHHYPWTDKPQSSNYTVLINVAGNIYPFSGSISYDETVHITVFDLGGVKTGNKNETLNITKSKK